MAMAETIADCNIYEVDSDDLQLRLSFLLGTALHEALYEVPCLPCFRSWGQGIIGVRPFFLLTLQY